VWTTRRCPPCLDDLTGRLTDVVARRSGPGAPELLGRLADGAAELPDDCWVLHWLAVAPAARGAGLATAAVRDLAHGAARAGAALYTETASPRATRLYLRAGLRPVGAQALPGTPVVDYSRLLRPPVPLLGSASGTHAREDQGG
jgi:GNAT superfamily N-acetyltransferase